MSQRRWVYSEAKMLAEADRGIGVCSVTGLVMPVTSMMVLADNHAWMRDEGLQGQVADYRGAALCVDEHSLMTSARAAMATDGEILRPTALVVSAEHLELFRRYSWLMADHGVCRAAFTETAPALEWVRRQAQVFAQWPAMRLPASAGCSRTAVSSVRLRPAADRA